MTGTHAVLVSGGLDSTVAAHAAELIQATGGAPGGFAGGE